MKLNKIMLSLSLGFLLLGQSTQALYFFDSDIGQLFNAIELSKKAQNSFLQKTAYLSEKVDKRKMAMWFALTSSLLLLKYAPTAFYGMNALQLVNFLLNHASKDTLPRRPQKPPVAAQSQPATQQTLDDAWKEVTQQSAPQPTTPQSPSQPETLQKTWEEVGGQRLQEQATKTKPASDQQKTFTDAWKESTRQPARQSPHRPQSTQFDQAWQEVGGQRLPQQPIKTRPTRQSGEEWTEEFSRKQQSIPSTGQRPGTPQFPMPRPRL